MIRQRFQGGLILEPSHVGVRRGARNCKDAVGEQLYPLRCLSSRFWTGGPHGGKVELHGKRWQQRLSCRGHRVKLELQQHGNQQRQLQGAPSCGRPDAGNGHLGGKRESWLGKESGLASPKTKMEGGRSSRPCQV